MRIIEFQAENYRRLSVIEIRPGKGGVVHISGRNGQGKTSVLNAIAVALGGERMAPREPIAKGKERAEIEIKLSNGAVVRRRFWRGKGGITSDLAVEIDQAQRKQPQAYLSALVGDLAFDPLAFTRMAPKDQFSVIAGMLAGFSPEGHERARKELFSERTVQNRIAEQAKAAAAAIALPPGPLPKAGALDDLTGQIEDAVRHNAEARAARERVSALVKRSNEIDDEIERTEARLMALRKARDTIASEITAAEAAVQEPVDEAPLRAQYEAARAAANTIALAGQRDEHAKRGREAEAKAAELTKAIEAHDALKRKAIAEAKLPVEGLGLDDGVVTLHGLPFDQASGAEQLRASIAIAMARNPTLRVMLVDEASSLDADSLALVQSMADAADYQLWLVTVAPDGPGGFVIEDGHVAG